MLNEVGIGQIKEAIKEGVDQKFIAGANLLIFKEGKEVFYHQEGYADLNAGKAIKRDTIFRLYSMSKPVTAAAVMILMERGKIDLFDPVSKYLEGFQNQKVEQDGKLVAVEREATIRDLLFMTSGLVYGGNDRAGKETDALFLEINEKLFGEKPLKTVEIMNRLGKCTLSFQPGACWQYGTSADVLGAVVEVVSGKRFGEFLRDELFLPLGMKDTGFWVTPDKQDRLAVTYEEGNGGLTPYTGNHLGINNSMDREPAFESGGAGLVSTVDDYIRFATMLIQRGTWDKVQILRPKTVEYLTTGTLNPLQQKNFDLWQNLGYSYGNLMRIMTDTTKAGTIVSPGEYGWDGWLGPYFSNCPKDKLSYLFMIQKTNAGTTPLTRRLRNIILSSCCD
jgi:CubicO group peptidase (beta-lactamase class C family)